MPRFQNAEGKIKTDVCVIGGGMAGILCAWMLKKRGIEAAVLEAARIGQGVTAGTTAVITAQHDILYSDLANTIGREAAKLYLNANLQAVSDLREAAQGIDCKFEERPSMMFTAGSAEDLQAETETLKLLGFNAEFRKEIPLPVPCSGAVVFPGMAQFHPLKFLTGAAKQLTIYENSAVRHIENGTAFTDEAEIHAKKFVVATHFPFINSHGAYFLKLYQQRYTVLALEGIPDGKATLTEHQGSELFFRWYGDLLLMGGGARRTGKGPCPADEVRQLAKKYFPHAKIKFEWSDQDTISLDQVPYIGTYGKRIRDTFVASGFNGWGMTTSMISARLTADMIEGRINAAEKLYRPDRSMMHLQLLKNIGSTVADFVIPSVKRCPHLGCTLRRNKQEHSWDCPCHGSRFTEDGNLIDGPAQKDAKV